MTALFTDMSGGYHDTERGTANAKFNAAPLLFGDSDAISHLGDFRL